MEVANASLLDEATAAAEAMTLLHRVRSNKTTSGERGLFLVSDRCLPQTMTFDGGVFGGLLQSPDES
jgi:glycine dehydrogenase